MKLRNQMCALAILLISFSACNKNDDPKRGDATPTTVAVTLDLGQSKGMRASDLAGLQLNNVAPTIEKVHIYVLDGDKVEASKEVINPSDEWTALNNITDNAGGIKFEKMSSNSRVIIEANPTRTLIAVAQTYTEQNIMLSISNKPFMIGEKSVLETIGTEPINPDPKTGATVKRAKVEVKNAYSRFQIVGVKFYNRTWNPAKGEKPTDPTDSRWKDNTNFNYTENTDWKIEGFLLNRFADNATVSTNAVITPATQRYYTTTYVGAYDANANTWSLRLDNVGTATPKAQTENAAYLGGTYSQYAHTTLDATKTAAAFNFFPQGVINKVDPAEISKNTAPKIHIILKKGTETRFVNVTAYKTNEAGNGAYATMGAETGKLYNINLSNETIDGVKGTPIVVVDDDPNNPGGNTNPDISKDKINIIAMVTVQNWSVVKLIPVLE